MINKLIIGGSPRSGELSLSDGGHPRVIRARICELHEASDVVVVHTWSPLVIFEVRTRWVGASEGDWLERVFLRRSVMETDVGVVHVRDPGWLAHFALEDLYLRGEFDGLLADSDSDDESLELYGLREAALRERSESWIVEALRAMGWCDTADAIDVGIRGDSLEAHREVFDALKSMLARRIETGWHEAKEGLVLELIEWYLRSAVSGGRLESETGTRAAHAADSVAAVSKARASEREVDRDALKAIASLAQDDELLGLVPRELIPRMRVRDVLWKAMGGPGAEDGAALWSIARCLRAAAARLRIGSQLGAAAAFASANVAMAAEARVAGRRDLDTTEAVASLAHDVELLDLIPDEVAPRARVLKLLRRVSGLD